MGERRTSVEASLPLCLVEDSQLTLLKQSKKSAQLVFHFSDDDIEHWRAAVIRPVRGNKQAKDLQIYSALGCLLSHSLRGTKCHRLPAALATTFPAACATSRRLSRTTCRH